MTILQPQPATGKIDKQRFFEIVIHSQTLSPSEQAKLDRAMIAALRILAEHDRQTAGVSK